jgi:hypothetical protein
MNTLFKINVHWPSGYSDQLILKNKIYYEPQLKSIKFLRPSAVRKKTARSARKPRGGPYSNLHLTIANYIRGKVKLI